MSAPVTGSSVRDGRFDLAGRVVVITGASSGLGWWLAEGLSAVGARLVVAARRRDRLDALAARSSDTIAVSCDVTVDADRERVVEAALDRFGRIDGLVNNAGALHIVPALKESAADFGRMLDVNLVGPFDLARRAAAAMRGNGGGSIVNVTSMSAVVATGSTVPSAGYCAAKAGLAHLTRELAVQWGRFDVRVNAVAPGMFATEMVGLADAPPDFFADRLALKRVGAAEDIVGAVQFLLSDASRYVTGQQLVVDGGRTVT